MDPHIQQLFPCLCQDLTSGNIDGAFGIIRTNTLDWVKLFSFPKDQGFAPLIYYNLTNSALLRPYIPDDLRKAYRLLSYRNAIVKEKQAQELSRALHFFSAKSIDVLLIQGLALGFDIYQNPWLTETKDIDLILRCQRNDLSPNEHVELAHFLHGKGIEYDFFQHHDMNLNGAVPIDFYQVWEDAIPSYYHNQNIFFSVLRTR